MKFDFKAANKVSERLSPLLLQQKSRKASHKNLSQSRQRDLARAEYWNSNSNIIAIGIGEKSTDRTPTGEFCLKFFVRKKMLKSRLRSKECIPAKLKLNSVSTTFQTDVEELTEIPVAHSGNIIRPLRPGASVGHFRGTNGTIGLIVKRIGTERPLLLSCSHVLALAGLARQGDPIEQPADTDNAIGPNRVGMLDAFTQINPNVVNNFDIAIALLDPGQAANPTILDIARPTGIADVPSGTHISVLRYGAVTGRQSGFIMAGPMVVRVRFPILGDRVIVFRQAYLYQTFSLGGDSGAAILNAQDGTAIGLHLAGNGINTGIFLPLKSAFLHLGLELF